MKTFSDKGRNRLRPLAGQTFSDDSPLDMELNINANKTIRSMYPLGTVFGTDSLVDSETHYTAGQLFPILADFADYIAPLHKPARKW